MDTAKLSDLREHIDNIKPKKHIKTISELINIYDEDLSHKSLQEENTRLQEEKKLNQQAVEQLQDKKKELETTIQNKNDSLKKIKTENDVLEKRKVDLNSEINKLKENKSFYNETLSGHRGETRKIFIILVLFIAIFIYFLIQSSEFIFDFYRDAIEQMLQVDTNSKIILLLLMRTGAGVIFYFIIRFVIKIVEKIFKELYNIFNGIREIESKLILVRAVTISTEKEIPFKK